MFGERLSSFHTMHIETLMESFQLLQRDYDELRTERQQNERKYMLLQADFYELKGELRVEVDEDMKRIIAPVDRLPGCAR